MWEILIIAAKILLAIVLGGIIGLERETLGKPAGSRTYALIAMGSCLLTILAIQGFTQFENSSPTTLVGAIISGMGFLGAGVIIFHKEKLEGLTTAAALWAIASVGIAIGLGWYAVAMIATIFMFLLLYVVRKIEFSKSKKNTLWYLFEKKQ
ncbi:MAG: MgtC/SapB family protein [Candidatus Parcubacteria bacterium]|nr:MgtC/SapB family protein [Candidatus Parcubacteria bacterium]